MRILTVFTGGTIGSKCGLNKVALDENRFKLIEAAKKRYDLSDVIFETAEPYFVLSENMTTAYWNQLVSFFKEINWEMYDGIIMTHGTDTLAYTSNFLGMLLGNKKIPIVLVSSNYAIEDERANGVINFKAAIDLIRTGMSGTFVPFFQKDKILVHLGTRLMQSRHFLDDFMSVADQPFGLIENGVFTHFCANPTDEKCRTSDSLLEKFPEFEIRKKVVLIHPYIGLDYGSISLNEVGAVLQGTYHSGTFCVEEDSFQEFYKRCLKADIPIFLAPISSDHANTPYASTFAAMDQGIIPLTNLSLEAAYCKLMILSQIYNGQQLKEESQKCLFFEQF